MHYSRLGLVYLRVESYRRPHLLPVSIPHQLLRVLLLEWDRSGLANQGEEFAGGASFESERDEEADGVTAYIAEKRLQSFTSAESEGAAVPQSRIGAWSGNLRHYR